MIEEKIEDGILIATMNHGKTNSITMDWLRQLKAVVDKVNTQDDIKGMILTGAGRTFSSGFDLPTFLGFPTVDDVVAFFKEEDQILLDLFLCKKPVIAAINGSAVAGGMILAMACDWRIMKNHPKLKMGMSEIKIGLSISAAQSQITRFGLDSARLFRDVMYFAHMYGPEQCLSMGAIDEIVEEDVLIATAKEKICTFMDQPGKAFIKMKRELKESIAESIRAAWKNADWHSELACFFEPEVRTTLEGVQKKMS